MAERPCVQLRDGRLHIPATVYDELFGSCPAVALMAREGQWWLLPLAGGAGGLQIKLRNPRGDRVIESHEFFRAQGMQDDPTSRNFALEFDAAKGAFRLCASDGAAG